MTNRGENTEYRDGFGTVATAKVDKRVGGLHRLPFTFIFTVAAGETGLSGAAG